MNRRARTGLSLCALALIGAAGLGVSGVVRIPWLSPAATSGLEGDRPDELSASDVGPGRELAASGGRPKAAKPGESATELPAEPALPSEIAGTAIGKVGGTIRGRVVETEAKRPVAGATVELLMPEALFHYLKANPVGRFDRLTVMTNAEGRFVMSSVLPSRDYALRVRKGSGAYATQRNLSLASREDFDVGDLVVGPSGGLSGHVVGADGKGIADARIAITWKIANDFEAVMADPDTLPWVEASVKTDAEGAWKAEGLEPGEKTLVVKAPSGASDVKASISVVAGSTTPGIDWTLGGALVIAGRVEWADGKPVPAAMVFAKTMKMPASFTVESGADGSFRLAGLAEGVYFVGAFIPGMSVQLVPGKKAGDENVRVVVPLAGALTGRVVSKSSGAPISQFRLTPVFTDQQDWMQQFVGRKIDKVLGGAGFQSPEGTFRIERLKAGHYTLRVEAEGYPPVDSAPVEVIAGAEAKSADIALPDGNRISGVVTDPAGKPIADATIVILNFEDFNLDLGDEPLREENKTEFVAHVAEDTRTNEKGAFTTSPLTPRSYDVGVRAKGYLPRVQSFDVTSKSIDAAAFRLERAAAVTLLTRTARGAPVGFVEVLFCDESGFVTNRQSDASGSLDWSEVRPGRWAAVESRSSLFRALIEAHRSKSLEGAAKLEHFRTIPGVVEFSIVAGDRVDRVITVAPRARIAGRVRRPSQMTSGWFALVREDDPTEREWVRFDDNGAFAEESVRVGRYSIHGLNQRDEVSAGALEVPEAGLRDIEIDLSK